MFLELFTFLWECANQKEGNLTLLKLLKELLRKIALCAQYVGKSGPKVKIFCAFPPAWLPLFLETTGIEAHHLTARWHPHSWQFRQSLKSINASCHWTYWIAIKNRYRSLPEHLPKAFQTLWFQQSAQNQDRNRAEGNATSPSISLERR